MLGSARKSPKALWIAQSCRWTLGGTTNRGWACPLELETKVMRKLIAAALVLIAAGCVAESDNPINATAEPVDERLLGKWRKTGKEDVGTLFFARAERTGLEVTMTSRDATNREPLTLKMTTATIKGRSFFSVTPYKAALKKDEDAGWIIGRYHFDRKDRLVIAILSDKSVKADIEAGRIAGRMKKSSPWLTASSEALRNWIGSADSVDALFGSQLGSFERVADKPSN